MQKTGKKAAKSIDFDNQNIALICKALKKEEMPLPKI